MPVCSAPSPWQPLTAWIESSERSSGSPGHAARRYHIVVLSDHGQSQGQTFRDRFGTDLGEVCTRLMQEEVASLDAPVEEWGRVESLAEDLGGPGVSGRAANRAAAVSRRHIDQSAETGTTAEISVLGSGNLGTLYVHSRVRLSLEDLQERWPKLVPGLCAHEGVGFIAGLDSAGVPWALGAHGRIRLDTGEVIGRDPLQPYGDHAARVLRRAVVMPEAPDLYVNSRIEDATLDIAAFEPLVGAHGGLGGWQDRAILLTPRTLAHVLPDSKSRGPTASTQCSCQCSVRSDSARRYPNSLLSEAFETPTSQQTHNRMGGERAGCLP